MADEASDSSDMNAGFDLLFERMTAGDAAARRELFGRLYDRLLALVKKFLRESFPHTGREPESVLSDLYIRLERALAGGAVPADAAGFRKFAAFKLRQVLIDDARARDVRRTLPLPGEAGSEPAAGPLPSREPPPSEAARRTEVREAVHVAVDRLPAPQREVVDLHQYLGLTQAEIARLLGLSPKEVSRLWVKALTALGPAVPPPG